MENKIISGLVSQILLCSCHYVDTRLQQTALKNQDRVHKGYSLARLNGSDNITSWLQSIVVAQLLVS